MSAICLGIDVGGTSAKYALVDQDGKLCKRGSFETGRQMSGHDFFRSMLDVARRAMEHDIAGIGICSLGAVDTVTGRILGAAENLPFLEELNLKEGMQEAFPNTPVSISNDVHAVAKGEMWLGAAKECNSFFCLSLGTGLGGALVINGQLVEGAHCRAGEIGYIDYDNEEEYLEKRVSTKAVVDQAAVALGVSELDGFGFFEKVRAGNPICEGILKQWVGRLSRAIANLIITLDLELILIGGGVSSEKEILIPRIAAQVDGMLPLDFRGQTRIGAAKFRNDAGILGAVSGFFV